MKEFMFIIYPAWDVIATYFDIKSNPSAADKTPQYTNAAISIVTRKEEFVFFSHEERYLRLLEEHPNIVERVSSYHISSFLGITNPSLSRIRKHIKK